ncbi:phospholipid methyltransferase [Paenibacillus albidus]|uniref:class I SAM-dependent methyltransferase n=1 Tax=Paenibacillus albidus TaxID=2041023 RepID=UPI001BEAC0B9|nr:phospholipid methyltransferase [Paenibacillus albidus]MBT2293605.1 phospholipid methyltransferase [Paenibacillus albidus]
MPNRVWNRLLFLYKFLREPRQFGSITPSSRRLAKALTDPLPWDELDSIAELGAGTGAVTSHIQLKKTGKLKVMLFEKDADFRHQLKQRFPGYRCYGNFMRLRLALHNDRQEKLDGIVNGLPLNKLSIAERVRFMEQVTSSLKEEGWFATFEYFPGMGKAMKRELKRHFDILSLAFVPLNIPPAVVYICRKKPAGMIRPTGRLLSLETGLSGDLLKGRTY